MFPYRAGCGLDCGAALPCCFTKNGQAGQFCENCNYTDARMGGVAAVGRTKRERLPENRVAIRRRA